MSTELQALQERVAIARVEMFRELRPQRPPREVEDDVFEYRDFQITRAGRKYNLWHDYGTCGYQCRQCWTIYPVSAAARTAWGGHRGGGGGMRWPTLRAVLDSIDAVWTNIGR